MAIPRFFVSKYQYLTNNINDNETENQNYVQIT